MDAPFDTVSQPPVKFRRFGDIQSQRQDVYDYAKRAVSEIKPFENANFRLEIADPDYDDGDYNPSLKDERDALLKGKSLHRPLRATVRLFDKTNNAYVDEQRAIVAHVPHLNSRGMFIRNGIPWVLRNQARLRPGMYARRKGDGGVEAHFNVRPGTGAGFRIELEPKTGIFKVAVGQSTTRLYPLLRSLGIPDEQLKETWGEELFNRNFRPLTDTDSNDLAKVVKKLGRKDLQIPTSELPNAMREILSRAEVDDEVSELTLGERVKNLSPEILVKAASKVLKLSRGEVEEDNRDSQAFQSLHSAEDYLYERLKRDQAGALRKLLWKAGRTGKLGSVASGILNQNIGSVFEGSGLAQQPEDINPSEIYDLQQAVTRMGEGGIASEESVSLAARAIQPSYIGVIDATRGPESSKLGLDLRVTDYALKGSDNKLYAQLVDARTGEDKPVAARDAASKVIAFPGAFNTDTKRVLAIANGQIDYVDRDKVDYIVPSPNRMMSRASALIPMPQGMKGQRLLMGARMTAQALPLIDAEAPLVSTADEDGVDLAEKMGQASGAVRADVGGRVISVDADSVKIQTPQGPKEFQLYNNYPTSRKTLLHNTPLVKPGDVVRPGQVLARSNFTDADGRFAVGRNLRVAYMAAKGFTHEDAYVISESAAKKLRHENMYKHDLDLGDVKTTKKADYRAIYADKFTKEQYDAIDDDGVVKEGTFLRPGDPIILAVADKPKRSVGAVMDSPRSAVSDRSQVWEHEAPGTVASVVKTPKGLMVTVRSGDAMKTSDKLSARFGNKGVISKVIPDEQMPILADGKPAEVIANSYGIISRQNPSALAEALLGKVAAKTGQRYSLKPFDTPQGMAEFALQEALKHGVVTLDDKGNPVDTEEVTDPETGRKIPGIFTGTSYFMKLHHLAESKLSARDTGGYTLDDAPAKGGFSGSKRIGNLDWTSLLAAGATEFLKDAKLVRGQRNDEYWRKLKMGETPFTPQVSFANQAFKSQLKAAGVNIKEKGTVSSLAPMLDKDVDELAGPGEVENSKTFDFESMRPEAGGLFDIGLTGGASGTKWSKITLPTKIPHPLFQEPIVRVLGLTNKKFEAILGGSEQLNGKTGPEAIEEALNGVDLDREIEQAKIAIRGSSQTNRDNAVRKLNYLHGLKTMGVQPKDLLISKIPVLPPKYRPIIPGSKTDMIHDMNYLYHDLLEARQNFNDAKTELGEAGEEYLTLYNAAKAVTGISSPVNPKTAEQGVGGILQDAIGLGDSPKFGRYIRKVLGTSVDTVGRGVITSDPDLGLDEIGVPEEMAWNIFKPFVIKRLVQNGSPASEAVTEVRNKSKQAEIALRKEMEERPIVYNRAPSLHKFNYVAAYGKLRKNDNSIGLPYYTLQGIAGDFDGDAINLHVPVGQRAVKEVLEKLLPSKNLLHPATFEPHLEPRQDFLAGLYVATQPDERQQLRVFQSEEEAKAAYKRGEISARTPIRIVKS